nr:hypothetical protein [uncultured Allomuricauda sp.]
MDSRVKEELKIDLKFSELALLLCYNTRLLHWLKISPISSIIQTDDQGYSDMSIL